MKKNLLKTGLVIVTIVMVALINIHLESNPPPQTFASTFVCLLMLYLWQKIDEKLPKKKPVMPDFKHTPPPPPPPPQRDAPQGRSIGIHIHAVSFGDWIDSNVGNPITVKQDKILSAINELHRVNQSLDKLYDDYDYVCETLQGYLNNLAEFSSDEIFDILNEVMALDYDENVEGFKNAIKKELDRRYGK